MNPFPPLPSSASFVSKTSASNFSFFNQTSPPNSHNKGTFANIIEPQINSNSTTQSNKRARTQEAPLPNKNNMDNQTTRKTLKNLNSFEPEGQNTDTNWSDKGNGYQVSGQTRNKQSKPKVNRAEIYTKSLGRDETNSLGTISKQFYIYLGRIDREESIESVQRFLDSKLKSIKIGDAEKQIKYNNLKELNTQNSERSFRSFVFSVGYLDRSIVDKKELWPLYAVVNKYKRPRSEWQQLYEKNKSKITPSSSGTPTSTVTTPTMISLTTAPSTVTSSASTVSSTTHKPTTSFTSNRILTTNNFVQ